MEKEPSSGQMDHNLRGNGKKGRSKGLEHTNITMDEFTREIGKIT